MVQVALLKENADLVVSLRGAIFFDKKKRGMDQIMSSMGHSKSRRSSGRLVEHSESFLI